MVKVDFSYDQICGVIISKNSSQIPPGTIDNDNILVSKVSESYNVNKKRKYFVDESNYFFRFDLLFFYKERIELKRTPNYQY